MPGESTEGEIHPYFSIASFNVSCLSIYIVLSLEWTSAVFACLASISPSDNGILVLYWTQPSVTVNQMPWPAPAKRWVCDQLNSLSLKFGPQVEMQR